MSRKNKPEAKIFRAIRRAERPHPERRPVSTLDRESVIAALTDLKSKLPAGARSYLRRALSSILVMPEPVFHRSPELKLADKLKTLTLAQVIRRRSQFARRAATAKHLLAALSEDSQFRPPIQATQDANLRALKAAQDEITRRTPKPKTPEPKLP